MLKQQFQSCYIDHNSRTLSQNKPSLPRDHVDETVRMQISLLKQPTICDDETAYNNSNENINKEVVTPTATATPHSAPFQLL
jgi:hypothetical protein